MLEAALEDFPSVFVVLTGKKEAFIALKSKHTEAKVNHQCYSQILVVNMVPFPITSIPGWYWGALGQLLMFPAPTGRRFA